MSFHKLIFLPLFLSSYSTLANQITISGGVNSSVVKGISQSRGKPVLDLTAEWDFNNGLYIGSNIYTGKKSSAPELPQGYSIYTGYFLPLKNEHAIDFSINQFYYKGNFQEDWNYLEYHLSYHLNHFYSISASYTENYFGRGFESYFVGINFRKKLSPNYYIESSVGYSLFDKKILPPNLYNGNIAIGFIKERWDFKLSYQYANKNIELIHGKNSAGGRFEMELRYSIY